MRAKRKTPDVDRVLRKPPTLNIPQPDKCVKGKPLTDPELQSAWLDGYLEGQEKALRDIDKRIGALLTLEPELINTYLTLTADGYYDHLIPNVRELLRRAGR